MSSSGNIPSPVVCPLAKLGRLSSSSSTVAGGTRGVVNSGGSPPPLIRNRRCFKSTSASTPSIAIMTATTTTASRESQYTTSSSEYRFSDTSCDVVAVTSSTYRHQQQLHYPEFGYQSSIPRNFNRTDNEDDNATTTINNIYNSTPTEYFQTTSQTKTSLGRSSPYLDQGYHTLAPPIPPDRYETTVITKYEKKGQELDCCHFERLPDVVTLRVFSWLSTNELCQVSRVCRRWHNLAWDQSLWKTITLQVGTCADKVAKIILRRLCGQAHNVYCCGVKQLFVYDGAKITDKGLSSLARRCPELTRVQIQNCPALTDSSVSELVTRCPGIQHLDLTGCSLVSSINLLPGLELQQKLLLQHLDLTDCSSVQDFSLRIILCNCPQLTFLYLRRCSKITEFRFQSNQRCIYCLHERYRFQCCL